MSLMRILGIGSPFGDDQVGWRVLKMLQQHEKIIACHSDLLQLEYCDRPGLRLLDSMQGADSLILIDAVKTDAAIGTLHQFRNEEIECIYLPTSTHGIGIDYALKLGRELQVLPKNTVLFGIEIGEILLATNLSSPVKQAATQLANCLVDMIFSHN